MGKLWLSLQFFFFSSNMLNGLEIFFLQVFQMYHFFKCVLLPQKATKFFFLGSVADEFLLAGKLITPKK